ncbi:MAG: ATP-binding cassette domain-containing protein [Candidatus Nitrosotenuis sp.]
MSDVLRMDSVGLVVSRKKILDNISLNIRQNSAATIMGPNGAGKTTLLKIAAGLIRPTWGELYFFGKKGLDRHSCSLLGYIPQNLGLVNELSVFSNIMMGALRRMPRWRSMFGMYQKEILDEAYSIMYELKLTHLKDTKVKKLSGGEKQRVAIARTLLQKPSVIFSDEMTASLDFKAAVAVMDIFAEIRKKRGITLLMTHHNPEIAKMYSDTVFIMLNGKVEKRISSEEMSKEAISDLYEA